MLKNIVVDNENFCAERDDNFGCNNERRRNRHSLRMHSLCTEKRGRVDQLDETGSASCHCTRKALLWPLSIEEPAFFIEEWEVPPVTHFLIFYSVLRLGWDCQGSLLPGVTFSAPYRWLQKFKSVPTFISWLALLHPKYCSWYVWLHKQLIINRIYSCIVLKFLR